MNAARLTQRNSVRNSLISLTITCDRIVVNSMETTTPATYLQKMNKRVCMYKIALQTLAGDEIKELASNEEFTSKDLFIEACKVIKAYYALLSDNPALDDD